MTYLYKSNVKYPKKDESTYFHFRYSIINEEQDEEQITLIRNCPDIQDYVISIIETSESETDKGPHRHVTFETTKRFTTSSIKKKIVTYKYKKNEYYFKPKYVGATIEQLIAYTIKSGVFISSDWDKVDKIENKDEHDKKQDDKKYKENKQKQADFREKFEHMRLGDLEWFFKNHPKYTLSSEFSKGLIWSQADARTPLKQLRNFYIIDKSGTGKTLGVRFLCDPLKYYLKTKTRDSWEGWCNMLHTDAHIDEVDSIQALECVGGFEMIKELAQHMPCGVKFMYGNRILHIRPQRIWITANTEPLMIFTKDKYGKEIYNASQMVKETLDRRFECWNTQQFFTAFGIKLVEVVKKTKKKSACVIAFDFQGMAERNYLPKWEYFDEYNIQQFKEHSKIWHKYGEEKYIQWRAYKEGITDHYKKLEQMKNDMNEFVKTIGLNPETSEVIEEGYGFKTEEDILNGKLEYLDFN